MQRLSEYRGRLATAVEEYVDEHLEREYPNAEDRANYVEKVTKGRKMIFKFAIWDYATQRGKVCLIQLLKDEPTSNYPLSFRRPSFAAWHGTINETPQLWRSLSRKL